MQVKIVRHHRRAQDPDRNVEHSRISQNIRRWNKEPVRDPSKLRPRKDDLQRKAERDHADQRDHQRLDVAEAAVLQEEDDEHVGRGQAHADQQRNVEQQLQGDRGPDHLRQVAGGDGDLATDPQ